MHVALMKGTPCEESGGTHRRYDPHFLEGLKWMGIDMASCTMNHAFDYMETGVPVNKANLAKYRLYRRPRDLSPVVTARRHTGF